MGLIGYLSSLDLLKDMCVQLWIHSTETPGEHHYENGNNNRFIVLSGSFSAMSFQNDKHCLFGTSLTWYILIF